MWGVKLCINKIIQFADMYNGHEIVVVVVNKPIMKENIITSVL